MEYGIGIQALGDTGLTQGLHEGNRTIIKRT